MTGLWEVAVCIEVFSMGLLKNQNQEILSCDTSVWKGEIMWTNKSLIVMCLMFFFLTGNLAFSEDYQWKLIKDKSSIQLYESVTPGSEYKTYRAVTIVNVPMTVLFEVLLDVPEYPSWMPGCKKASMVKMLHPDRIEGDFVIHVIWDAIWPFKDRDLVVEVNTDIDWENQNRVVVNLRDTDDYPVPSIPGKVRIKSFNSQFDFQYVDRTTTRVSYRTMIEPGGHASPGLAKIQTATIPIQTIEALAQKADAPKYYDLARQEYF